MDSSRIEFLARGGGRGGAAASAAVADPRPSAFRHRIEVSLDGREFSTVVDKTDNTVTRYTEFDEIPPSRCRYVRLTVTGWPRQANAVGVVEFTVFGKPVVPSKW